METIKKTVFESRKIKEKTWKTYERYIKELAGDNISGTDFLTDTDKINEILSSFSDSKRRMALAVILVVLSPDKSMTPQRNKQTNEIIWDENSTELYKHYHSLHGAISKIYTEKQEQNQKSEKQASNWASWEQILKLQRKYMNTIRRKKYNKKTVLTKIEQKYLQDYLIISLYTLIKPRRLDYGVNNDGLYGCEVANEKDYNQLPQEEKENKNVLVIKSNIKKYFMFGSGAQKTEAGMTKGLYKMDVPKSLNRVLQLWRKFNVSSETFSPLLLKSNKSKDEDFLRQLTKDGLSKSLMRIFKAEFPNKKISAQILRTIFKTHFNKSYHKTIAEKKKCAEEMGHSFQTGELHYVKLN